MESAHRAILENLPPRPRRSKLDPYAALIRALRARGRSYREIVGILQTRCGLSVGTHTLYHFVRTRLPRPTGRQRAHRDASVVIEPVPQAGISQPTDEADVWRRIEALKQRPAQLSKTSRAFAFNDDEPLALIRKPTETKKGRPT